MNLNILPMMDAHVPAIAELEHICFFDPWSENSVRAELNNPYSLWLIAEADGELVGYIGSQTAVDEADIMNVAVAPSHRRCGIGQMLIDELAARLKEQGVITAVATNKPDAMCKMVLEDAFPGCIDIAYGQREDIAKKPEPEVVFRIMQDAGVEDKADVIYVGDSDVDIYTGLNAGVDTVGVLWGFRDKAELAGAGAPILCATNEELYNTIISK